LENYLGKGSGALKMERVINVARKENMLLLKKRENMNDDLA
jgi:hypothetical protein